MALIVKNQIVNPKAIARMIKIDNTILRILWICGGETTYDYNTEEQRNEAFNAIVYHMDHVLYGHSLSEED